jgi:predicted amidohydrolase YtcJ
MVVLDRDILTIDPLEIIETNVLKTIVNGKIVYERNSAK